MVPTRSEHGREYGRNMNGRNIDGPRCRQRFLFPERAFFVATFVAIFLAVFGRVCDFFLAFEPGAAVDGSALASSMTASSPH